MMGRFIRLLGLCVALMLGGVATGLFFGPHAYAQGQSAVPRPDYEAWLRIAGRADEVIEASRASTPALESLREQLSTWRQQFVTAQGINANAIATVQAQLDALGPLPEGSTEAPDIALQRTELNVRLADLQAPVKTAELAQRRADGLIKGIDNIIRERQARELFELESSPINPGNWAEGYAALIGLGNTVRSEFLAAWGSRAQQTAAKGKLPVVLTFVAIGLLLILRGRRWARRMSTWALGEHASAGRWIAAFFLSLGTIILPFIGIFLLIAGIWATNLLGLRGEQVAQASLGPIFSFLLARWLASRIFPADEARTLPLNLDAAQRRSGRLYGASLGLVAAGYFFISEVAGLAGWSNTASNVILFPFLVVAGLMLLRLARLLDLHRQQEKAAHDSDNFRTQIPRFLAIVMVVLAFASPALAAIGYFKLAHFLMFPALLSLQILGVLLVLQRLVVEVYVLITGNRESATESLVPVLIGLLLVILSLPFFAIAWGARPAQLWELWTRFTEGIELGGVKISPTVLLTFALVFALGLIATKLLQGVLKNTILPKTRIDQGGRNAIVSGVGYIGIFLAALIAVTGAGLDLSSIAIVAGALSVGIGFGLRTIVENFVSGIILLIERPISEGDWIEVGGVHGTVRHISVRSTRIETFDRSDVIVPNADLVAGRVTNYTRFNSVGRLIAPVGVAYGNDTRKVEAVLQKIAESHPMILANPAPAVLFRGFGADSLDFEIRAILRDVNFILSVHSELNHQIADCFKAEGIEIPFAQRDIWIRNPEVLGGQAPLTPPVQDTPQEAPATETGGTEAVERDGDGAGDGGSR